MPRYFFDFTDTGTHTPDPEGTDLPTENDAKEEAIRALVEIVGELLPDGNHRELSFTVRDQAGQRLMELALRFDAKIRSR